MEIFEEMTRLAKAMSDINRVKIITLIQREKKVCVCEICDTLELSQPLVSRHLKQLKECGMVIAYKDRKWMMYEIQKYPTTLIRAYLRECRTRETALKPLDSCMIR